MKTSSMCFTLGGSMLATAAMGQNATVMLHHDDADGIISVGETVTWSLSIAFENAQVAASSNMEILADNTLGVSSDFVYAHSERPNGFSTGFIGGYIEGSSNGAGIDLVRFFNSLFFEGCTSCGYAFNDNPLVVGTFTFTATRPGTIDYSFALGRADDAFVQLDYSAFQYEYFDTPDDVAILTDSLTIIPAPASALLLAPAGLLAARRRR